MNPEQAMLARKAKMEDLAADLLTLAAGYDRRTVGDADIEAWAVVALKCGWTFETARRALVEHFERSDRPIMPSNINAILDSVRKQVRARITVDLCPPRDLRDNPAAEIAWRRQRLHEHVEGGLNAWALGQEIPSLEQPQELQQPARPELAAAVRQLAAGVTVPRVPYKSPSRQERGPRDGRGLAQARKELALRSGQAGVNPTQGGETA